MNDNALRKKLQRTLRPFIEARHLHAFCVKHVETDALGMRIWYECLVCKVCMLSVYGFYSGRIQGVVKSVDLHDVCHAKMLLVADAERFKPEMVDAFWFAAKGSEAERAAALKIVEYAHPRRP